MSEQVTRTLTIDRGIWLQGRDSKIGSYLLRPVDEKMCCLGIYLEVLGVTRDRLWNKSFLTSVGGQIPEEASWLLDNGGNSLAALGLADVNDNTKRSKSDRERMIANRFAKHGVKVEFIGAYPKRVKA